MTIATERVDAELVERPRRWSIRYIHRFIRLPDVRSLPVCDARDDGAVSDWLVPRIGRFGHARRADHPIAPALILFKSRPGVYSIMGVAAALLLELMLPFSLLAGPLVFCRSLHYAPVLGGIVVLYVFGAELAQEVVLPLAA